MEQTQAREIRKGLPPLPARMSHLPVNDKGYPIPWFVQWVQGKPDFRVTDLQKMVSAVRDSKCWICGGKLGKHQIFNVGPMCAVNRMSAEPPSHKECADFAATACPFLVLPKSKRREANLPDLPPANPYMAEENPGITVVWHTDGYELVRTGHGVLLRMNKAIDATWFSKGVPATKDESKAAVEIAVEKLLTPLDPKRPVSSDHVERVMHWKSQVPFGTGLLYEA